MTEIKKLLHKIVPDQSLHLRWLLTLSFMENAGARKISACEDPLRVSLTQLKHAAEEHRHAYYLRKLTFRLGPEAEQETRLLAPVATRQYLHRLDTYCSRYLKNELSLSGQALQFASYLLVTCAIELRADALYPVYQEVLRQNRSKVTVGSIIAEEEGHLEEMLSLLQNFRPDWQEHADQLIAEETRLFQHWLQELVLEIETDEAHREALVE